MARRGLSVATWARVADLAPGAAQALAIELARANPLRAYGLLIPGDDEAPAAQRPYAVAPAVLAWLAGGDPVEPPLRRARPPADELVLDAAQRAALAELRTLAGGGAHLVLSGASGTGRTTALAHALGEPLVVLDAATLARGELVPALLALRRAALLGAGRPVIVHADELDADAAAALRRFLDGAPVPVAITTTREDLDAGARRPLARLRWPTPDVATRQALWARHAGGDTPALAQLASRYPVGASAIHRAASTARALGATAGGLDADALERGLRHAIAERMGDVATRVEARQGWDDLVLADDILDQVRGLIARVRHAPRVLDGWGYRDKLGRGAGVAALFSGPPGTGKTMVAGLVARELGLELYQVDLSQVVSKWVGETEKQLARIFDCAEQGHALLLFDEADALFGQRSAEVKSAVDRYANLEVNFLLQRVESFGGVVVLTTNLDGNIDHALKRRLAAHVVFAPPDEDERERLWARLVTTARAPLGDDLDHAALARQFPRMSGAHIRNAALAAAFLAAAEPGAATIEHEHLVRAARAEYRSMGHVLAERGGLGGRER